MQVPASFTARMPWLGCAVYLRVLQPRDECYLAIKLLERPAFLILFNRIVKAEH